MVLKREWYTGSNSSVATGTAEAIIGNVECFEGVVVKAADANSGLVYIGPSGVTTGNGFELGAGDSTIVPVKYTGVVYGIASQAGQKVTWMIV